MNKNKFIVAVDIAILPNVEEYAANIATVLNAKLQIFDPDKAYVIDNSKHYIFIAAVPLYLTTLITPQIMSKWILFNVNPLSTNLTMKHFHHVKSMQNLGIRVLSYANDNRFKNELGLILDVVPCPISRTDRYYLINLMKNIPLQYDVAFYGEMSERSKAIIDSLSQKISIVHVTGFKTDRDSRIAGAKILLNIHPHEDYRMYNCLYYDRWAVAGKLVISEECASESLGLPDHNSQNMIIQSPYHDLIKIVLRVLTNYDKYQADLNEYLRLNLADLINKREKTLAEIMIRY